MKRLLLLFAVFFSIAASYPTHYGYVTDRAGILTTNEQQTLNMRLRDYEKRTTNEFAVLIIPSLDGQDIKEYANGVFHEWGIGKRAKNNGVLLLWSTGDRRVRIEVGYGLEPYLTDGRSGQIIRENILPNFKQRRWHTGVYEGVNAVIAQLDTEARRTVPTVLAPDGTPTVAVAVTPVPNASDGGAWFVLALFIILIVTVVVVYFVLRVKRRREEERERERVQARRHAVTTYPDTSSVVPKRSRAHVARSSEPVYIPVSSEPERHSSYDSGSSWSSSSDSGSSFGGGDSGGGGADGSY